jgi:O-antigen ligase
MNNTRQLSGSSPQLLLWVLGITILISIYGAIAFQSVLPLFIAPAVLLAMLAISDYKWLYYMLFPLIPMSVGIYLSNGLGTDLPVEPLMAALTLVTLAIVFVKYKEIDSRFFLHPLSLLLFLHLSWILFTTLMAEDLMIAIKFTLAKTWYILPFYVLTLLVIKRQKQFVNIIWLLILALGWFIPLVLFRHASHGFSFFSSNFVLTPFFSNHVAYGTLLVVILPFVVLQYYFYRRNQILSLFLLFGIVLFLVAIYFSYVRIAMGAIVIGLGAFFMFRLKLTKYFIIIGLGIASYFVIHMIQSDNYLAYAPSYEKTISHKEFDDVLGATVKGEDLSTMERVYRWVAGYYMIKEKPLTGFGPGNFYSTYRPYTVSSFRTYVSDNPERSGIHSYYLMTAVEQGLPGLFIFLLLVLYSLLKVEKLYHSLADSKDRLIILSAGVSLVIIYVILILNDMIEHIKIGPFFFLILGLIVIMDVRGGLDKIGEE